MQITIRRTRPEDAAELGRICYEAFKTISEAHNFTPDLPSPELALGIISMLSSHSGYYGVAAEVDGRLIGSNFLDERSSIGGIGPITIDPAWQNRSAGRQLMEAVLQRTREKNLPGVRLVQAAFHNRSLSLYAKLGFQVREPLSCLQGPPIKAFITGCNVRVATEADMPACNRLCFAIHGHDRAGELQDAVKQGMARVVERGGGITGYASVVGFFGHAVGATNDDLKALIGAADEFNGPGFLLPSRNAELLVWCLVNGLRITQPMTLMTVGLYNEPAGAYLPSILY
ncbi:MAG TPA: GNAT family N-acetyltransferase [Terriglobia bacterium]|nr:GNAT family N-acetyltransferase [Terriglobia bacterium]